MELTNSDTKLINDKMVEMLLDFTKSELIEIISDVLNPQESLNLLLDLFMLDVSLADEAVQALRENRFYDFKEEHEDD